MMPLLRELIEANDSRLQTPKCIWPLGLSEEKAREIIAHIAKGYLSSDLLKEDSLLLMNDISRGFFRDKSDNKLYMWSMEHKDARILQARIETNPSILVVDLDRIKSD